MIDEMTNPALVEYVKSDMDATETELELADRLAVAITEIEELVREVRELQAAHGANT